MATVADNAATAGREIIQARIARSHQRGIGIHHQCYAGAQSDGTGQKYILQPIGAQHNSLASSAVIDGVLDALGIQFLLILRRDHSAFSHDACVQRGAGSGDMRFGDLARVLSR